MASTMPPKESAATPYYIIQLALKLAEKNPSLDRQAALYDAKMMVREDPSLIPTKQ